MGFYDFMCVFGVATLVTLVIFFVLLLTER
nr:MAG TPA: hypothetical protein [Caudoviricetes sp.]